MSELGQAPGSVLPENPACAQQSPISTKRRLLAALFSAVVPGAGQLLVGQRRKGTILLGIFAALLVCFWPLRLLRFYAGFCVLYCGWIALYIYAACSAQLARPSPDSTRPSKGWLVATIPFFVLILSLSGGVITRASGFRNFAIPSTSMEQTIQRGDHIVADMRRYNSAPPLRQDVVIFKDEKTFFVKRVIAVGGDTIEGKNGMILVNGFAITEAYVRHDGSAQDWMNTFGPVKVPDGQYFVMGDNRDLSLDSRSPYVGPIDRSSIVGKALYVFSSDRQGASIR